MLQITIKEMNQGQITIKDMKHTVAQLAAQKLK